MDYFYLASRRCSETKQKQRRETRDSDERKREVQLCLDTLYFYTINTFESLYFLTFTEVHKLNQFSFYI